MELQYNSFKITMRQLQDTEIVFLGEMNSHVNRL